MPTDTTSTETAQPETITTSSPLFDSAPLAAVPVEHLCDMEIEFDELQRISSPAAGQRLTVVVKRGVVRGPKVNGEFLPGGGDWIVFGDDGVARLDVRATLRLDDGHLAHVTNNGRHVSNEQSLGRWASGELVTIDDAYTRSAPLFETDSPTYAWLNGAMTIAFNEVATDRVHYRVYRVQ